MSLLPIGSYWKHPGKIKAKTVLSDIGYLLFRSGQYSLFDGNY